MIDLFNLPTVANGGNARNMTEEEMARRQMDGMRAIPTEELKKRQIEMADSMRNTYPSGGLYGLMKDNEEAQNAYNQQLRTILDNVGKPQKRTIWQRLQLWWISR